MQTTSDQSIELKSIPDRTTPSFAGILSTGEGGIPLSTPPIIKT